MEQELKKKWIEALRSGEFKQCRRVLRKQVENEGDEPAEVSYCCLGVLSVVKNPNVEVIDGYQLVEELIPDRLLDDYGLTSPQQGRLTTLNDGGSVDGMSIREHTFAEIADYIETHLDSVV